EVVARETHLQRARSVAEGAQVLDAIPAVAAQRIGCLAGGWHGDLSGTKGAAASGVAFSLHPRSRVARLCQKALVLHTARMACGRLRTQNLRRTTWPQPQRPSPCRTTSSASRASICRVPDRS